MKEEKKKKIKEYRGFEISHCGDGLRVTRINDEQDRHTHLKCYNACYNVIDDVLSEKLPYSRSKWYLISLMRLSTNPEYINKIQKVLDARENKTKYRYRYAR